MKVSIGGYSFFNTIKEGKMDVFGYLETVRYRYGMNTVDLWNGQYCTYEEPLLKLPDESVIKKIREALDEKEMTLVNIAVDGAHIWEADPDVREAHYQNIKAHLNAAVALGAKSVRIDTGGREFTEFNEEQMDYVVSRYREFSQHAADNGYMIGPENHMGPSLYPQEMVKLAKAIDHPNYGILVHFKRWRADAEQGDEIVAPYVYHTHFDGRTAAQPDAIDLIKMMKNAGYDGYWGAEYNAPNNQYAENAWLLATVKKLLLQSEIPQ